MLAIHPFTHFTVSILFVFLEIAVNAQKKIPTTGLHIDFRKVRFLFEGLGGEQRRRGKRN